MPNIYRIFPTLWEGSACAGAQTVYAIDRNPGDTIRTACSSRPREDPASVWDNTTFWRLLPPPDSFGGCCQPAQYNSVTWAGLPTWISWALSQGYTLQGDMNLSKLKPYGDFYIVGP